MHNANETKDTVALESIAETTLDSTLILTEN